MGKTGLLHEAVAHAARDWRTYQQKENTPEALSFQDGLKKTLDFLREVSKSSPEIILDVEMILLIQERETYANSPEMMNSIKPALSDLADAKKSLNLLENDPDGYAKVTAAFSGKDKERGLPLDSCRKFIRSHQARLTNRLRGVSSVPEKNILRQRKENLAAANKMYKELQRESLGLKQGLEQGLSL